MERVACHSLPPYTPLFAIFSTGLISFCTTPALVRHARAGARGVFCSVWNEAAPGFEDIIPANPSLASFFLPQTFCILMTCFHDDSRKADVSYIDPFLFNFWLDLMDVIVRF
jgi:hypothetical protein